MATTPHPTPAVESTSVHVLPVVAETLEVRRETVTTGTVRVDVTPVAHAVPVELDASGEQVEVERVPVGRVVDRAEAPRREGDTWIVPVYEERLVTERRLVLVEEVRLHRRPWHRRWREDVVLRHDEVRIERTDPPAGPDGARGPAGDRDVDGHRSS